MPEYSYKCRLCGSVTTARQPMVKRVLVPCAACGGATYRRYQAPLINWNGLAPSQGELPVSVQRHLAGLEVEREAFEIEHEQHERRTAARSTYE